MAIDNFRLWCTKYIIPVAYDESLSYGQQLVLISDKLNEVINSQNTVAEEFKQLQTWIDQQLQTYVDTQLNEWLDDGTLSTKIENYINSLINPFETQVNTRLDAQDTKINTIVASGSSPIIVDSTSEMTDINRIYLLSSNGHIYYYNGTSFIDSGLEYGTQTGVVKFMGNNLTLTNDFNTFPTNSIFTYTSKSVIESISNSPTNDEGILFVWGGLDVNSAVVQLYTTYNNTIYSRVIWGSTIYPWTQLQKQLNLDIFLSSQGNNIPTGLMSTWKSPMTLFISDTTLIPSDAPLQEPGIFTSLGAYENYPSGGKQQFYTTYNGKCYTRCIWGSTVYEWSLLNPTPTPTPSYNNTSLLLAFPQLTCCGDSLTYSVVYTSETSTRQAVRTYPQIIECMLNLPTSSYAIGGISATEWWERYNTNINNDGVYIVYLGTNGGLTNTVDTDCVGNDLTSYAQTNTGYYGRILQTINNNGGKAILVKVYASSSSVNETNQAIEALANRFNCAYVENARFSEDCYHLYADGSGLNEVHYNDMGYAVFAEYLLNQIGTMSSDLKSRLIANQ